MDKRSLHAKVMTTTMTTRMTTMATRMRSLQVELKRRKRRRYLRLSLEVKCQLETVKTKMQEMFLGLGFSLMVAQKLMEDQKIDSMDLCKPLR